MLAAMAEKMLHAEKTAGVQTGADGIQRFRTDLRIWRDEIRRDAIDGGQQAQIVENGLHVLQRKACTGQEHLEDIDALKAGGFPFGELGLPVPRLSVWAAVVHQHHTWFDHHRLLFANKWN